MSAKIVKAHPLNGAHTAGIFADMSIDGPEIGTLVLVVDRAKNLPNRKTIGKQDPYCAARLGKEAKKTTTDIRGGQTPRWDQELRFTVHDSPDYYQLKISVFNDDKKTDLIGEAWVDLHDIIVPGGGQSDIWHSLSCRGKYAGEIRVEITYYDTRPKPERPVVKAKNPTASERDAAAAGQPRMGPRRRPLPNEPSAGPPPSQQNETAPRPQPALPASHIPLQSPLQAIEYNTEYNPEYNTAPPPPPPTRYPHQDQYTPGPSDTGYGPSPHRNDFSPFDGAHPAYPDEQEYDTGYRPQQYDAQGPQQSYSRGIDLPELPPMADHRQLPPDDDRPPPPPAHRSRTGSGNSHELMQSRSAYDLGGPKGTPPTMRHDVLRSEAHRHSVPSQQYPGRPPYKGYDSAPSAPHVSPSGFADAHQPSPPRHHSYDSSYDPAHRSMQPTVEDVPDSPSNAINAFRTSGSRIPPPQAWESEFDSNPNPAPLNVSGRNSALSGQYNGSAVSGSYRSHDGPTPVPSTSSLSTLDYASSRDLVSPSQSSYTSYGSQHTQPYPNQRNDFDDNHGHNPNGYGLPPVPSSLVPGVDPALAQEISDRIYEERRRERRPNPQMSTPPAARHGNHRPHSYAQDSSPSPYGTPSHSQNQSPAVYTGSSAGLPLVKPHAVSPIPSPSSQHTIKRKSISPAPPPSEGRRLSGVPFAPDSYDALNPAVSASKAKPVRADYNETSGKIISHDGREIDPSDHLPMESWAPEPEPKPPTAPTARQSPAGAQPMPSAGRRPLRTSGRPQSMATPPRQQAQYIAGDLDGNGSPSPPVANSGGGGRNRLQKKANRASAMPILPSSLTTSPSPAAHSSPLAPIPHPLHQDNYSRSPQQQQPFQPGRSLPRSSTWDYPNENHAPVSRGGGFGPPIPAKVPIGAGPPVMSGALQQGGGMPRARRGGSEGGGGAGGVGGQWDLVEEMSRIDIGSGRARRHGGGY